MRDIIVIDTHSNYAERTMTYYAYHPSFEEVKEGDMLPTYVCCVGHPKKWIKYASN